jgi:hypothetical protein
MNLGELYLALQQGTVDAQENPLAGTVNRSFHEVQKYFSMSRHVYTPVTFVMNGAKYESLTPEQQETVKRVALEAAKYTRELGAKADEEFLVMLRENGNRARLRGDRRSRRRRPRAAAARRRGRQVASHSVKSRTSQRRHSRARGARPENPGNGREARIFGFSGLRCAPPEDDGPELAAAIGAGRERPAPT